MAKANTKRSVADEASQEREQDRKIPPKRGINILRNGNLEDSE